VEELRSDRHTEHSSGHTLFELVITLTVLSILVMGSIPIAQNAVKRQKEIKLRETLRQIRTAIDEFKRDTVGACAPGAVTSSNPTRPNIGANVVPDPRSRVVIDDCTIFDVENLDRYPPSLEILVDGVRVKQRGLNLRGGGGLSGGGLQATEINATEAVLKAYLRTMPVDPMTNESNWQLRSSYQPAGDDSWDSINVFDIRSASSETALNGEKYSDW
jgi:general secretion pathway protein G